VVVPVVVSGAATGAGTREGTHPGTAGATAGPRATRPSERRDPGWVDAAPFRAHLKHLMAAGSLDAPEVAVVLGLSTRAVRHLLDGRAGRVPRRISPHTAHRLLVVRADDVRGLRWCLTPADAARAALRRLLADGWTTDEVASAVGVGLDVLASLEDDVRCNRLLAVRLVGLARRLPSTLDDEDLLPVPSAA
jgi:hypothetical protein